MVYFSDSIGGFLRNFSAICPRLHLQPGGSMKCGLAKGKADRTSRLGSVFHTNAPLHAIHLRIFVHFWRFRFATQSRPGHPISFMTRGPFLSPAPPTSQDEFQSPQRCGSPPPFPLPIPPPCPDLRRLSILISTPLTLPSLLRPPATGGSQPPPPPHLSYLLCPYCSYRPTSPLRPDTHPLTPPPSSTSPPPPSFFFPSLRPPSPLSLPLMPPPPPHSFLLSLDPPLPHVLTPLSLPTPPCSPPVPPTPPPPPLSLPLLSPSLPPQPPPFPPPPPSAPSPHLLH